MNNHLSDFGASKVLGVPVNRVTMGQVLEVLKQIIAKRQHIRVGVVNAAKLVNMKRDEQLRVDVMSSDIILADGASVVLASKLLRPALPERVTGIDLMFGLLELSGRENFRVYFLGASEKISAETVRRVQQDYPGVVIAGRQNGYFGDDEEERVAQDIAESKANILFVAMTSPKKELFMGKWGDMINVNVIHGVGGSFDVYAGKVQRAPELWQRLGLEWLYRVKQEPGRLWKRYLITNTLFASYIFAELFSRLISGGRGKVPE